jgi:hypothetical protein
MTNFGDCPRPSSPQKLRDRDTKFTDGFDAVIVDGRIRILCSLPRASRAN